MLAPFRFAHQSQAGFLIRGNRRLSGEVATETAHLDLLPADPRCLGRVKAVELLDAGSWKARLPLAPGLGSGEWDMTGRLKAFSACSFLSLAYLACKLPNPRCEPSASLVPCSYA